MPESTTRTRQSIAGESTSLDVIDAVATSRDEDPMGLPPLHRQIDPEALDSLFRQTPSGSERSGQITFEYSGFVVTVSYDGEATISLVDES
jgi:hypothetical protein